ncbi:hypothetical protein PIB30_075447 [Stylosanthes scabra]|uniref:Ubiquitin-like protease family profile domain-containing protein n=1 Tax=Stylosanthes scabra TaxID=79078 RepID=A0ABU6YMI5_9FABA|nr:hypothetical protein [Stylosanthes scabra]
MLLLLSQINQLVENADAAVDPPSQGVAAIDDVLVTPPDCGIEVVEATSAEDELISRELSESTANLVVETNVEKGDIAEKEFDCGVYVLKYMDIVNPSLLGKKNFTVPVWAEDELQRFKEEFVERILYDDDNYYKHQAIKASNATARHPRPSTALQSPYTQLQSADLELGKLE